ncbi:MAG: 23S rRNA (pseudouridine(1915)-N(3))-methyltransferase RlmH [Pseudomonadota bacterium]
MKLMILAVGRLRSGPEAAMVADYIARFKKTGRVLGFSDLTLVEIDERKALSKDAQAKLLLAAIPVGSVIWACDENGEQPKSEGFARNIQALADTGTGVLAIVIGGADGLGPAVLDRAQNKISFGRMVWPHMLVRVMLTEQLYRAASILAGLPYHRA